MRLITEKSVEKFLNNENFKMNNTEIVVLSDVTIFKLFNNAIAYKYKDNTLKITNCGYQTNTTKDRLNGLPNVNIKQKNGNWFLNGIEWNGELTEIN